jgi:hypothetical protein
MKSPFRLGKDKKNGQKPEDSAPGTNGHKDIERLSKDLKAVVETQGRIIQYLNQQSRPSMANVATQEEKRDLLEKVVDPPRNIMPAMSNLSPLSAFLIPCMDVIKYNYMPVDQLPKKEGTDIPLGFYELWERSYYMHQLGKEGKQTIRLAGIAETRAAPEGQGVVAT